MFAILFKTAIAQPEQFEWEQSDYNPSDDPFLKQFDAHGNFIEIPKPEHDSELHINYTYKKRNDVVVQLHTKAPQATETFNEAMLPNIGSFALGPISLRTEGETLCPLSPLLLLLPIENQYHKGMICFFCCGNNLYF